MILERLRALARPMRPLWALAARLWQKIPADIRLFLAMMALLVPIRAVHTSHIRGMYVDGGYYTEVARHVRDGLGLTSHVSLYHFGYETFPYPTSVYPLWPWLLGMCARVIDLEIAAHWLPFGFAMLAALGAFLFGRALWPEPLFPEHVPGLHAGHIFLVSISVHREFVTFTSLPYTEGISWALTFLFLWRVARKGADLGIPWAIESGIWLSLLYFSRYQLIVAPLAALCAYTIRLLLGPSRGRILLHAGVSLGICYGSMFAWWMYVRSFVPGAGLSALLRFDQNRANDWLTPVDIIVENHGLFDFILDRLEGVLIAWDPVAEGSYHATFHTMHWALAVALPLIVWAAARKIRERGLSSCLRALQEPAAARWWLIAIFAAGALLSVHAIHKHYYGAWYFTKRQGLVSLLSFSLSLVWLLRLERITPSLLPQAVARFATTVGVFVFCSSLALGAYVLVDEMSARGGELRRGERYAEIGDWLQAAAGEETLVVAIDATLVQRIAWRTTNIGYHWIDGPTPYEDLLTMTDRLGARYVVFRAAALKEADWVIFGTSKARFDRDFVPVANKPEGYAVFERRPAGRLAPIRPARPARQAPTPAPEPCGGSGCPR